MPTMSQVAQASLSKIESWVCCGIGSEQIAITARIITYASVDAEESRAPLDSVGLN
jgi:hypothetical protein